MYVVKETYCSLCSLSANDIQNVFNTLPDFKKNVKIQSVTKSKDFFLKYYITIHEYKKEKKHVCTSVYITKNKTKI